jgi:hypothetical protein
MRNKRVVAAVVGAILLVLGIGSGVAYAYWSASGQGSGATSAGTLQPVTVTALVGGDTPSSSLLPGTSADVVLRIDNPNAFTVTLVSVAPNGAVTADGSHPGCTTTGVTFTNQTGLASTIAASGTTLVHLSNAASMSSSSSSGCQGATFSVPVAITVHKP